MNMKKIAIIIVMAVMAASAFAQECAMCDSLYKIAQAYDEAEEADSAEVYFQATVGHAIEHGDTMLVLRALRDLRRIYKFVDDIQNLVRVANAIDTLSAQTTNPVTLLTFDILDAHYQIDIFQDYDQAEYYTLRHAHLIPSLPDSLQAFHRSEIDTSPCATSAGVRSDSAKP